MAADQDSTGRHRVSAASRRVAGNIEVGPRVEQREVGADVPLDVYLERQPQASGQSGLSGGADDLDFAGRCVAAAQACIEGRQLEQVQIELLGGLGVRWLRKGWLGNVRLRGRLLGGGKRRFGHGELGFGRAATVASCRELSTRDGAELLRRI